MIIVLITMVWDRLLGVLTRMSVRLLGLTVCTVVAYSMGWLHRCLLWIAEREATKLLNHTRVTASRLEWDLWRGRYWASNVIIHAPRQSIWHWEAPVLARIGKVYVEVNLVQCLLSLWCLWEEIPVDIHTVQMSDIQVFVERKHGVYNFFLLDPHVILPDPRDYSSDEENSINDEYDDYRNKYANDEKSDKNEKRRDDSHAPENNPNLTSEQPQTKDAASSSSAAMTTAATGPSVAILDDEEDAPAEKAQQVVDEIMTAVKRIAQGNDKHWQKHMLQDYKTSLTDQLKTILHTRKKKTEVMQEGVQILKHVSKNISEKTVQAQKVVLPARRQIPGEKVVYGRVGRVLMQDCRVFLRGEKNQPDLDDDDDDKNSHMTKDSSLHDEDEDDEKKEDEYVSHDNQSGKKSLRTHSTSRSSISNNWNAPILIRKVAIRASEFCPPLSSKDPRTIRSQDMQDYDPSLPALYQPMDVYLDVVWKRVLAEMAKSNTGRFFQTAMGEVADVFTNKNNSNQKKKKPSNASSSKQPISNPTSSSNVRVRKNHSK
jgi:hypothetical protein